MKVNVIDDSYIVPALLGIGLSYGITSEETKTSILANKELLEKCKNIVDKLALVGNGENKFLRQCPISLDITAPMYWWKEFDTYKIGTTAQSESTMHTLLKKPITQDMFESPIPDEMLKILESLRTEKRFRELINMLPMGWLQRRIVTANYAVLQNIYNQRKNHKLIEWHTFIDAVLKGASHPNFICKKEDK